MTRRPWTSLERARLASLRRAGNSVSECAARLGRPLGSVSQCLYRMGLCKPINHVRRKRGALTHAVKALRGAGHSMAVICDILGVGRGVAYEALSRGKK